VISIDFTGFDLFAFPLLHILRAALARGRAYGGSRYKTGPLPARLGADAEKVPAAASRAGGHRPAHRDMAALDLAAAARPLRSPMTSPPPSRMRPRRRRRPCRRRRYLACRRPTDLVAAADPDATSAARAP
jgi:hypothetical protein